MGIEAIGAIAAQGVAGAAGAGVTGTRTLDLLPPGGVAANAQVQAHFQQALANAGNGGAAGSVGNVSANGVNPTMKSMFGAVDQVDVQARAVSRYASAAEASGGQLTPGEMVQLTMKCSEFMFQAQLTSNIANRSSDGVQQLFKQQ